MINESTLAIEGLWRGEQLEPFVALSLGTREQLAIVVRLAVADPMAQRGQSVPLLLDDALTFVTTRGLIGCCGFCGAVPAGIKSFC